MPKQKIAVLGGGISALSAVYYLTDQPDWQDHYEITVYQMGWRLGGKIASGNDAEKNFRIEDTGVHFCMGFYENFFRMIRACYEQTTGDKDAWKKDFLPENKLVFMEYHNNQWKPWQLNLPPLGGEPGDGLPGLMIWEAFLDIVKHLTGHYTGVVSQLQQLHVETETAESWWERLLTRIKQFFERLFNNQPHQATARTIKKTIKPTFRGGDVQLNTRMAQPESQAHPAFNLLERVADEIKEFVETSVQEFRREIADNDTLRHDLLLLELGAVIVWGMLRDGVLYKGFTQLDEQEFSEWLRSCGASDALIRSPLIQGLYEGVFAFEDGDFNKPSIAAGVALYTMLRQFIAHNGSLIYRMSDSTGTSVFTPLYQVLKERGVKFQFFNRVMKVNWSAGANGDKQISSVEIERQVDLTVETYDPLATSDNPDAPPSYWPVHPIWAQLDPEQAAEIQREGINLELYSSHSVSRENTRKIVLELGSDFDQVISGIPIGALPCVCADFGEANPKWADMIAHVKTVSTQSFEVWFTETLPQMGWSSDPEPIVATYIDPFAAWGDMAQLLSQVEKDKGIKTVIHFAAVLADLPGQPATCALTMDDHEKAKKQVHDSAIKWLNNDAQPLWPQAVNPIRPEGINWDVLYVFDNQLKGSARFEEQYWRANIDPSIRYDQSLPKSIKYRLKTDESGFSNLYLAGTWIDNGLNVSLMESGVMSGMLAAGALSKAVTGTASPPIEDIIGLIEY